jgi:Neutral/alkaline non-lysosomal ceramidase, N-terminal
MNPLRAIGCGLAIVLAVNCTLLAADPIEAGVAVVDITPPIPFRMSGYFEERLSTGVKDRLHAKAIVFRQGDQSAALVFCDLIGMPPDVSTQARQQASNATGIPVDHIAVTATHTHTGPLFFGSLRNQFHERSIKRLGKDPYETIDFPAELVAKIVAAVAEAKSKLQPVQLKSGYAEETRLAFNRRFHMKDGSVRFNPGVLNPGIIRPAGPIDPQVGVITLTPANAAQPTAAIVSFALHLDTTGGTEYSADFPKFCEDRLRKEFGPEFALLFGTGTCGDVNHIDVMTRERRAAPEIGQMLGDTVVAEIERIKPAAADGPGLAVRSATVDAPLQTYSPSELTEANKKMALIGTQQLPFLEQVKAAKIVNLQMQNGPSVPLNVQAFRLNGDTAIVTLPGEIFVELGLAIKRASPFKTTLVIELANQSPAYIPTKRAFAEGSYEIVNSQVQPGVGERLAETAIGLLKDLQ